MQGLLQVRDDAIEIGRAKRERLRRRQFMPQCLRTGQGTESLVGGRGGLQTAGNRGKRDSESGGKGVSPRNHGCGGAALIEPDGDRGAWEEQIL